jgi:hypothetical protein
LGILREILKIIFNKKNNNQTLSSKYKFILAVINILLIILAAYNAYAIINSLPQIRKKQSTVKEKLDRIPVVEVLNGCGYTGIADKFTNLIRSKGFDVVKTGNFVNFDVDTTFIIDRFGNKKYALAVADSLKIPHKNVIQHFNKNYFLDVTFVIGKDFNNYLKRK